MPGFNPSYINIASQFGMPLFGVAGTLPFTGNFFWVDETNGSDGSTGGPQDPLKTLAAAHTKCLAGNNDVVFLTGTAHVTATLTWSKNRTHLIGLAPTLASNARARISSSGANTYTPMVDVSASECIFENIGAFSGISAASNVCWHDSGGRNYYKNCAFIGINGATALSSAGSRSLVIDTAGENYFEQCQIGGDTSTRSTTNASLGFAGGTPRNTFRNCIFPCETSSAGALFITAPSASVDRWQWFQDCLFVNNVKSASTPMTVGVSMGAGTSPAGLIMMQRCSLIGATAWGDTAALGQMYVDGAPPTAATSGIAVNPA